MKAKIDWVKDRIKEISGIEWSETPGVWISTDGRSQEYADINDNHLQNIIKKLEREVGNGLKVIWDKISEDHRKMMYDELVDIDTFIANLGLEGIIKKTTEEFLTEFCCHYNPLKQELVNRAERIEEEKKRQEKREAEANMLIDKAVKKESADKCGWF